MSGRRPGRPTKAERPDRIADITRAAIAIFGEQGYGGSTFAAVARAAGMTPAALYRYFDDKAALYLHAGRVARERIWAMIGDSFQPVGSLVEDFDAITELMLTLRDDETQAAIRLLASLQVTAAHHPELSPLLEERWQIRHTIVGDIGRRAHASGELVGFDDSEDAALAVELLFSGLTVEMEANPALRHRLVGVAGMAIRGLTASTSSTS